MSELKQLVNERIEALRPKLQDTSRRNPLINNTLTSKSASFLKIVDEIPQQILDIISTEKNSGMQLIPLPPTDIDPLDEDNEEFIIAFRNAQSTDEEYLAKIEEIDFELDEKAYDKEAVLERELRDKVRELLDMPPRPAGEQQQDLFNHARSHNINPLSNLPHPSEANADGRHDDDALQTLLLPKTFQSRMRRIFGKCKMYQDEKGLNVAFLVLGYLRWSMPHTEGEDEFKSPLILIPVELTKPKNIDGEKYSISKRDDIILNPTLLHKLKTDASVDLHELTQLLQSEQIDVEEIFSKIHEIKPKNMRWDVKREASFGVYPYQGIEQYNDLDTASINFSEFPLLSEIMLGKDPNSPSAEIYDESDIETSKGEQLVPHLVLDADSSQFIALMKLANEQNVALEGPPGSGKSQTIVNAVANAILNGKKVLFAAQKTTALEVVYNRLKALGLSQFALPLMGGHGSSEKFYEAVKDRIELRSKTSNEDISNLRAQLRHQRERLERYIEILTSNIHGTSLNVHQILGLKISNFEVIKNLDWALKSVEFSPQNYSDNFNIKSVDEIGETITKWCTDLSDNKLPDGSIWRDADALNCDLNAISSVLRRSEDLLAEYEHNVSKLSEKELNLFDKLMQEEGQELLWALDQCSADSRINLSEIYKTSGFKSFGNFYNQVIKFKNFTRIFDTFLEKYRLTADQAKTLQGDLDNISKFNQLLSQVENVELEFSNIENLKEDLDTQQRALTIIKQATSSINAINENFLPTHLSDLLTLKQRDSIFELFTKLTTRKSVEAVIEEIEEARKNYKKFSNMSNLSALPTTRDISEIKENIQSAGFFSFLSSTKKNAKNKASEWITRIGPKDSDERIISALDALIDQILAFKNLDLADHIDFEEHEAKEKISKLEELCEGLRRFSENSKIPISDVLNAMRDATFDDASETIGQHGKTKYFQTDIGNKLLLNSNACRFIDENTHALEAANSLLVRMEISDRSRFIAEANEALKQKVEIDSLTSNFNDALPDKENFDEFTSILDRLFNQSSTIQMLILERDKNVVEASASCRELNSKLRQHSLELKAAKKDTGNANQTEDATVLPAKFIEDHLKDKAGLQSVVTRRSAFSQAKNIGLDDILSKIENVLDDDKKKDFAIGCVVNRLMNTVADNFGSELVQYNGVTLNDARKSLKELDGKLITLASVEVNNAAVDNADPPRGIGFGKKSEFTEQSLLDHQLNLKRRQPPRKVIPRARQALMEYFPCWMMVPSEVAQLLPRSADFDLVIIDEASQMTPEHSMSALMRAQTALIAGDTNQLPPTNFFRNLNSNDEIDEDVDTVEESILELANIQFHPKHRLLWHYRSKHEDLIAFSNHYVYDSELVIFPSPGSAKDELGVSLVRVNGRFQRGINPTEVQAMADAIEKFMEETPHRSLGVAVMNQAQMEQLDAEVARRTSVNKKVADYIDKWEAHEEGLEKFFVKNLESIQGDERDVIFVGTVYGRDAEGKFYQRFGPINGASGKRRLNVLFSRAKEQMVTFTSIPMEDFHPQPTNEGATLFKRWLEYSATKRLGEKPQNHDRAGFPDSPFEEHVIEAINSLGFEAVPQVGVSSYFIDIGVKHPTYPFGYICGVECDGATYHSSKSARDRDRLREEVLNRLGWELYRIWSTDWFRDPLACRDQMKSYLNNRLQIAIDNAPKPQQKKHEVAETSSKTVSNVKQVKTRSSGSALPVMSSTFVPTFTSKPTDNNLKVTKDSYIRIRYTDAQRGGTTQYIVFSAEAPAPGEKEGEYKVMWLEDNLAQAVLGRRVGDEINFELRPGEKSSCVIIEVED